MFSSEKKRDLSLTHTQFQHNTENHVPYFLEPKVKIERAKSAYHQNKENIHIVCDLRISQER